jgi:hypothetical protein
MLAAVPYQWNDRGAVLTDGLSVASNLEDISNIGHSVLVAWFPRSWNIVLEGRVECFCKEGNMNKISIE